MTGPTDEELPAPLRDFLVDLAMAVQRHGLYPDEHPSLGPLVDRLQRKLEAVLRERETLQLAVSPASLVLEEGETDPDHYALRELAGRLHEHELARVTFERTPDRDQVASFLRAVSARPDGEEGPLGDRPDPDSSWPEIRAEPVRYDRLVMTEAPEALETTVEVEEVEGEADELWMGLARSVLTEASREEAGEGPPGVGSIARALGRFSADEARARTAAARMLEVARKLQQEGADADPEVRDRLVTLLEELSPEALGEIFGSVAPEDGQAFLEATADWLPVDTVLEVVRQVGRDRELGLSFHMLQLLSRLADHVETEEGWTDPMTENAFRQQVRTLLGGWQRNIRAPDPGDEGALPGRLGARPAELTAIRTLVAPDRLVQSALEVDRLGPAGEVAVAEMMDAGGVLPLLEILRDAPPGEEASPAIWRRVATPEALGEVLERDPPDFDAVDELLERLGGRGAGPMLDALAESGSRTVRRELFSRLVALEGEEVEEEILERLEDDRWFVNRNMLALLADREALPAGFSALPYTGHERAPVRREAHRLALRHPDDREEAIRRGLRDTSPSVLSLAFGALEDLPAPALEAVLPVVVERVRDEDLATEFRRRAIRSLGRAEGEEALESLLSLCRTRRLRTFWKLSLADGSPLVLEALRALARGWSDHPEARGVLAEAREATDPELREAAAAFAPAGGDA